MQHTASATGVASVGRHRKRIAGGAKGRNTFAYTVVSRPRSPDTHASGPDNHPNASVITTETPDIFDGDMLGIARSAPSEIARGSRYEFLESMTPSPLVQAVVQCLKSNKVSCPSLHLNAPNHDIAPIQDQCQASCDLGHNKPHWLSWRSSWRFLPPEVHGDRTCGSFIGWLASFPYLDNSRTRWKGKTEVVLYLLGVCWILRDSVYVANTSKFLRAGRPLEVPNDIPGHVLSSEWTEVPLDVAERLVRVLLSLLKCSEEYAVRMGTGVFSSALPPEALPLVQDEWLEDYLFPNTGRGLTDV